MTKQQIYALTEKRVKMFWIPHREKILLSNESVVLHVSIRYWLCRPIFSFLVFWNCTNFESDYQQWTDISHGTIGPKSWDRLHLSEIFGVFGLFILLWLIGGKEVLTIDSVRLRIRKEILGVGWSSNFQLADIRSIRSGWFLDPKARGKWNPNHMRVALYFDFQGEIQSFDQELITPDALRVEEAVRKSFPEIVPNRG